MYVSFHPVCNCLFGLSDLGNWARFGAGDFVYSVLFDEFVWHAIELMLNVFDMQGGVFLQLRGVVDYLRETAWLVNHGHLAFRDPLGRLPKGSHFWIFEYQFLSDVLVRFYK